MAAELDHVLQKRMILRGLLPCTHRWLHYTAQDAEEQLDHDHRRMTRSKCNAILNGLVGYHGETKDRRKDR